jgi:CheY-like chemotaxis protein
MVKTRKQKILSIEPNRKTATAIAKELSDRGFKPSSAHDGQEGLVAILKEKPDLVLCDIDLPIMSGFEVLERLIDIAPRFGRMPFVFMTGQAGRKHELKGDSSVRTITSGNRSISTFSLPSSTHGWPASRAQKCGRSK